MSKSKAEFEAGIGEFEAAIRKALPKEEDREGARQIAEFLACAATAEMMSERFKEDFPGDAEAAAAADMISNDPAGAVAALEAMVEGDDVLNDGPTHAFYRKLLDDHRESVAKLDELPGK